MKKVQSEKKILKTRGIGTFFQIITLGNACKTFISLVPFKEITLRIFFLSKYIFFRVSD